MRDMQISNLLLQMFCNDNRPGLIAGGENDDKFFSAIASHKVTRTP